MKQAIIILAILLALLLVAAGLLWTGIIDPAPAPTETAAPPEPVVTTEPTVLTTVPPTETEPPTEPEPELTANSWQFVLDGVSLETWLVDGEGEALVSAEAFVMAAGLDADGIAWAEDKARVSYDGVSFELDGAALGQTLNDTLWLPLLEVAEALGYPVWEDTAYSTTYLSPSARAFELPADVNIPVLMYHAVSDDLWGIGELFVSPSDMDAQLKYLTENGYDCICFEDLAHIEDYDKPVILTFDDGYDDNYTELYPLLQKYQAKATIFVIGNAPGRSHKMTAEQIRELADSGLVSIQSHGYTHGDMDVMDEATLDYELGESQRAITRITGRIPNVICFPTGKYSDLTLEVAEKYYCFGLKIVGGLYNTDDDPMQVNRYYISRYTDIYTFAAYVDDAGT